MVSFTILGRERSAEPQIELHLFWCIKETWQYKDMEDWYLIIGNILLFIPLGIIVPAFFEKMGSCWKMITAGFGGSLCIETAQLALHKGLFELDDLFHNTLGCYL